VTPNPSFRVAHHCILGQVVVHSLSTTEAYAFDMKRPMRTVAMEPNFARRSTRAVVYGGLAGMLVLREKGWLGHKETTLHAGEGPIWQVRWRSRLIAWANDQASISSNSLSIQPLMINVCLGRQDLRHSIANTNHIHRPTTR